MSDNDELTFAVAAHGQGNQWHLRQLPESATDSLDELVKQLRRDRTEGAVVGLVCIDDDWCAVVRPVPGGVRVLLSDATASLDYYLANDMLDELDVDTPSEQEAEE